MNLYHYRSISNALLEINNSTLHFSAREELNDPIEGYACVYWQSDRAAWEGLLENYICSVYQAIELYLLAADEKEIHHNSLIIDRHRFDHLPYGVHLQEVVDEFMKDAEVQDLSEFYGNNDLHVESNELKLILRFVHDKALLICLESNKKYHFIPQEQVDPLIEHLRTVDEKGSEHKRTFFDKLNQFSSKQLKYDDKEKERRQAADVLEGLMEDYEEIIYINHGLKDDDFLYGDRVKGNVEVRKNHRSEDNRSRQHRNWMAILVDFPEMYVEQLKDMIYPEGYVVCFSRKDDDSAMWGNYADNHSGVCLMYDVDLENEDACLDFCTSAYKIRPVEYNNDIVVRNFFETFGRLTPSQIHSWLEGTEAVSKSEEVFNSKENRDRWRDKYWDDYRIKWFHKVKAWKHEEEYRAIISNTFGDFEKSEDRNCPYNMNFLKGVIFGINTSEYDKMRIVEAIYKKSDEGKLADDFKFYQAYYDDKTQTIRRRKKAGWKIKKRGKS